MSNIIRVEESDPDFPLYYLRPLDRDAYHCAYCGTGTSCRRRLGEPELHSEDCLWRRSILLCGKGLFQHGGQRL